ncbi:MAG: M28 family metallopeptidase [Pseudomonadota bacterium]
MPRLIVTVVAACLLGACSDTHNRSAAPAVAGQSMTGVDVDRFRKDVEVLSSDEFAGRAPSSVGEELTVDYLVSQFEAAGAIGGNNGSFVQDVALMSITPTDVSPLNFRNDDVSVVLDIGDDAVVLTSRQVNSVAVTDSEVVFAGYGIVAPEYDWNDYEGIDVAGKTVVLLVNDPGYATGNDALFTGNKMTFYGRWSYKFEEAARQGAAGVIIVHETGAAGYPWGVVEGGWTGEQFTLQSDDRNAGRCAFEGWISGNAAAALFAAFGHDFAELVSLASSREFSAIPLGASVSTAIQSTLTPSVSQNVVALLPGAADDETVAFTAHWDHFGIVDNGEEDSIYNGAVDNATGTAALLEMARVLADEPRRRSYLFLAVTAEESGLLGSAWFAEQPTVSLARMAGLINIDAMNVHGATNDVTVIGYGSSELEDSLARAAAGQNRVLVQEPTPEKGFFYRSDHFSFAKKGVPVLYAKGGVDHVEFGREYGLRVSEQHIRERYHQASDEIHDGWDWAGLEQDLNLYLGVARELAASDTWPDWLPTSEFHALRAQSDAQRR